jgi:N-acetylneuraminic acid mutarotase
MRRSVLFFVAALLLPLAWRDAGARELSFQERVRAQEAIERVYYRHQIGTTMPFEEAVPRAVLEQKVERYLKLTEALRIYWHTDIGADSLRRELARIASRTRFPDRLREIDRALGHDGFLMQECLARPVLVERMARSFFAGNSPISSDAARGADSKRTWDEWWAEASPTLRARDIEAAACAGAAVPAIGTEGCRDTASSAPMPPAAPMTPCPDDTWSAGVLDDEPPALERPANVWTGSILFVWGGINQAELGARYDPATDSWQRVSTVGSPTARQGHTAVWAGNRVVVWGGIQEGTSTEVNTGGRYDPITDTWTPTSTIGAPSARLNHSAVSTGGTMIVWGGLDFDIGAFDSGGRYDVATDSWTPTSLVNAPEARNTASAVWTGSRMILWGGFGGSLPVDTGGSYDPATDTWTALSTAGAPEARFGQTAVWTGNRMIVWGGTSFDGSSFTRLDTGGRYDPGTDSWADTALSGAPAPRNDHTAVWTGSRMIVWGGRGADEFSRADGALYDPSGDTWTPTASTGAPQERDAHVAAWTGSLMIVWGGAAFDGTMLPNLTTGGRYDPSSNSWTPTFTTNAPSARVRHLAVWTGNVMIVWGGYNALHTGSRYDPVVDAWSPMTNVNAPSGRDGAFSLVWTGSRAIVWGGIVWDGSLVNTGGRYDPIADAWTATSTTGAPSPRIFHTAVWTGSRMIVWGGQDDFGMTDTGGRYDPATDTWSATATVGAPSARSNHTAIWTDKVMVIWAGFDTGFTNTGGRYNPMTNTWQGMTTVNAPEPRRDPPTIWTGMQMVTWGGFGADWFNTGGRYNPKSDAWQPTSTVGAPAPRETHTAVWTGKQVIVWGGRGTIRYNDGGRYNPKMNTWAPVTTTGAPMARYEHTAVWTGNQMIVWGGTGFDDSSRLNDGSRYTACP